MSSPVSLIFSVFLFFGTIAHQPSFAYPQQRSIELGAKNSSSGVFAYHNVLFAAPTKGSPTEAPKVNVTSTEPPKTNLTSTEPPKTNVTSTEPPYSKVTTTEVPKLKTTSAPLTTISPKGQMQQLMVAPTISIRDLQTIFVTNPSLNELESSDTSREDEKDFDEYSYEVEEEPEAEKLRLKLCPGSPSGRQRLLYDLKERKCAKVGEKAHCGNQMSFRHDAVSDMNFTSVYGFCECDYGKSTRPLVYHAETNSCYFVYDRAYCGHKEWLVFNGTGHASCEKKSCPAESRRKTRLIEVTVRLNGTGPCVKLNQPSEHCTDPSDTVHFRPYELFPKCGPAEALPAPRMLSPFQRQSCSPGSFLSFSGRCTSAWAW